jgi:hypothetical protein
VKIKKFHLIWLPPRTLEGFLEKILRQDIFLSFSFLPPYIKIDQKTIKFYCNVACHQIYHIKACCVNGAGGDVRAENQRGEGNEMVERSGKSQSEK